MLSSYLYVIPVKESTNVEMDVFILISFHPCFETHYKHFYRILSLVPNRREPQKFIAKTCLTFHADDVNRLCWAEI